MTAPPGYLPHVSGKWANKLVVLSAADRIVGVTIFFMASKRALIVGISGQDGGYLAKFLIGKGYQVFGTSRDAQLGRFENIQKLGISDQVVCHSMSTIDFRSTLQVLKRIQPHEIYNLAGQTSVGLSFEQPVETLESVAIGTLNLLECVRFLEMDVRVYNASSGECFGDTGKVPATEETIFKPASPYAVAKSTAHWLISSYRKTYGIHACSGFLFNHESPFRPSRFVTPKVVQAALRISQGSSETLHLGDTSIERDWGWAPEYVEAMWLMLQQDAPEDFVIATGTSIKLEEFVEVVFETMGLDWRSHVTLDKSLLRTVDQRFSRANPKKAFEKLGWRATTIGTSVPRRLAEAALDATQVTLL